MLYEVITRIAFQTGFGFFRPRLLQAVFLDFNKKVIVIKERINATCEAYLNSKTNLKPKKITATMISSKPNLTLVLMFILLFNCGQRSGYDFVTLKRDGIIAGVVLSLLCFSINYNFVLSSCQFRNNFV